VITAYHRPQTIQEAMALLGRPTPHTVPLGGGTLLSHGSPDAMEVVDLQALDLAQIKELGKDLEIGATATLQALLEHSSCPAAMRTCLKLEAPLNLRNSATVAGTIVTCDGRSTLTAALLALDAKITILEISRKSGKTSTKSSKKSTAQETQNIGDFLALRPAGLITKITIPIQARLAFEYVSRTPADTPIVCVALAQWPSGRTRVAVAGFGTAPRLAMDGTESSGADVAARNACHDADDPWGSAAYRADVAGTLAKRCLEALSA
jgi:CO/xanthine dehydrogenase FAD-binding subunit